MAPILVRKIEWHRKSAVNTLCFCQIGAWCAGVNNEQQYLQIDFRGMRKVTEIASQGRPASKDYVANFKLSFSLDGSTFEFHRLVRYTP